MATRVHIWNIYAPYDNRSSFCDRIQNFDILGISSLINGGDFNMTLDRSEMCGVDCRVDPIFSRLLHLFDDYNLIDIASSPLVLTWHNGRSVEQYIEKRFDRFLVHDSLCEDFGKFHSQVEMSPLSDHCPILLMWWTESVKNIRELFRSKKGLLRKMYNENKLYKNQYNSR